MVKKILLACLMICAVICGSFTRAAYAEAEYSWARIEKNGITLYATENLDKPLFELEKSYYVEILETVNNAYMVTVMPNTTGFPAILGYVRKSEVKPVEVTPLTPVYPTEQLYVTADSAQLKLLPLASSQNVIVAPATQKMSYYGKLGYYGNDWYYVYCGGKFGYVQTESVSKPQIALHPTPLEVDKPVINPMPGENDPNDGETEQKSKTPAAEIVLIVFVTLLAGGLTLALFLPGNGKRNEVFEQDI